MKHYKVISRIILVLQVLAGCILAAMLYKGMGLLLALTK
jgi:hypothetical protein